MMVSSCFLILLYKKNVIHVHCGFGCPIYNRGLVNMLSLLLSCFRLLKDAAKLYMKVPFLGAVLYLTLSISPFCVASIIVWVYRCRHFAWIGHDILGVALIIRVIQIIQASNLKV
ncbi:hypothetical protein QVD17_06697 [Tagetes erecta]|uniref:Uncharacterized protein n=1 Tax=Tagetes erecta TaxID=13708 RepID=A0AAD8P6R1_TARER|nr:hypothetical protein QVD17_06697 [Tagetes erecta]